MVLDFILTSPTPPKKKKTKVKNRHLLYAILILV